MYTWEKKKRFYVSSRALYDSETWSLNKTDKTTSEALEM